MIKILAVEDDLEIQRLLKSFLVANNYSVIQALDGMEALELFDHTIDLVLLDIMLPKFDGFTVCEMLRKITTIPIIMLTALDSEHDQLKGFDLRVDDYITKPFSVSILMRKIEAVLRRVNKIESLISTLKTYVKN